ncbi:MAG: SIR2 family protein [Methanoregula sp.]
MPSPDEVIPVAFALHHSPRRYALLVGSGISRDTGIFTAGEITDDLIRKVAGKKIKPGQKPQDWYKEAHEGRAPTFTSLFDELAKSKDDRTAILRPYFEPEDKDGKPLKIEPTSAHMSIARLVRDGIISMIITTNFDPLLEEAIKKETGKTPVVITHESDPRLMEVAGDQCRIVMVNGKYPSTDLKLTPEDLASYDANLADYLNRIFSEYGLVVCGWSGEHDKGLVKILTDDRVRRFALFWCSRDAPEKIPENIGKKLHLSTIGIRTANEFFADLESRIDLLHRHERTTSLTVESAIKKVKDALRDPRPELMLSDLLNDEIDRVLAEVNREDVIPLGNVNGKECFKKRLEELEQVSAPLIAMIATLTYYDNGVHSDLITETIDRLINIPEIENSLGTRQISGINGIISGTNYLDCFQRLRYYPALLVIYASGITATRRGNFNSLAAVLERPRIQHFDYLTSSVTPFFDKVNIWYVLLCVRDWMLEFHKKETGKSGNFHDYLLMIVQGIISTLVPNEYTFEASFDSFEYLYGLSYMSLSGREPSKNYPLSSRLITLYQGPYFDDARWIGLRESARKISVQIPNPVRLYFSEIAPKLQGSTFFNGDLKKFERCNRKYCEFFCIEPVHTGIDLSNQGRVL